MCWTTARNITNICVSGLRDMCELFRANFLGCRAKHFAVVTYCFRSDRVPLPVPLAVSLLTFLLFAGAPLWLFHSFALSLSCALVHLSCACVVGKTRASVSARVCSQYSLCSLDFVSIFLNRFFSTNCFKQIENRTCLFD